ncbi:MAG: hypothetical protein K2N41_08930 [Lachnospiraceae bacterium]|nr:hypothetical protein [Lachnospiraceae bacterium]MDE7239820.1 hypothetical protein [Lachnospiraceae bacterium]
MMGRMPEKPPQSSFEYTDYNDWRRRINELHRRAQSINCIYTSQRVIDIAMKYGYDSEAAFSRAVRNFIGNTPSKIRKEGTSICFPKLNFQIRIKEGEMIVNETAIVKIEEHRNEKVVCFTVDCVDTENEAWGQMSEWCKMNIPDRTVRKYVGVALSGHHPQGAGHQNASEHIKHPYKAMMSHLISLMKMTIWI